MLSYQHAFHAGGPADVHKHVALCALLTRLAEKQKAFIVVDLHAGEGVYDLAAAAARKTLEYTEGIARLWPRPQNSPPPPVQALLSQVTALNPDGTLRWYPGSPALARSALRAGDLLILNELHPAAHRALKRWAAGDPRIGIHHRDSLEALGALTPPPIRRGMVLIDPSYEVKSEYAGVPEALRRASRKWKEGIFFIWYPLLPDNRHRVLLDELAAGIDAEILVCELNFGPAGAGREGAGLQGTGFALVNPPWRFDADMGAAGDWLARALGGSGSHGLRRLKAS